MASNSGAPPTPKLKPCVVCGTGFVARNRTYTTCSEACQKQRQRQASQRWDEENPERSREHNKKSDRTYKTNHADLVRLQKKQSYAQQREIIVPKKFGLTPDDFRSMLAGQKGRCGICGGANGGRRLCIDHDHQTGQIRGLLCHRCNTSLGLLNDDPLRLLAAVDYLMRASAA